MATVDIEIYDSDTEDTIVVKFPAKRVVCHDCNGEGFVLNPSMRYHAYTEEEFFEAFDDGDREEYFTRGGIYDVICPTCKGRNVIDVLDRDAVQGDYLCAMLKKYDKQQREEYYHQLECEAERRMGC